MKRKRASGRIGVFLAAALFSAAPAFAQESGEGGKTEITIGLENHSTSYARGLIPPNGTEVQPLLTLTTGRFTLDLAGAFYSESNNDVDSWGFGGAFLNPNYRVPVTKRLSLYPGLELATFPAGDFDFSWGPRVDWKFEGRRLKAKGKAVRDMKAGDGFYSEGTVTYPTGPVEWNGTVGFADRYFESTGFYARPSFAIPVKYNGVEFKPGLSYTFGPESGGFQSGWSADLVATRKFSIGSKK